MRSPDSTGERPANAVVSCADEVALARFAMRLAAALPPRAMLAIEGDLGAGKTTFVKKLAAAVGIDPSGVTSPTFTLVHVHEVPPGAVGSQQPSRLVHIDAYRLTGIDDLRRSAGRRSWQARAGWPWSGPSESLQPCLTNGSASRSRSPGSHRGGSIWRRPAPPSTRRQWLLRRAAAEGHTARLLAGRSQTVAHVRRRSRAFRLPCGPPSPQRPTRARWRSRCAAPPQAVPAPWPRAHRRAACGRPGS